MPQVLLLDKGKTLEIERTFVDGGEDAEFQVVGGRSVLVSRGRTPAPMIHRGLNGHYFYADGKPITDAAHLHHLPEPYHTEALAFLARGARPDASRRGPKTRRRVAADPGRARTADAVRAAAVQAATGPVKVKFDPREALGAAAEGERRDAPDRYPEAGPEVGAPTPARLGRRRS